MRMGELEGIVGDEGGYTAEADAAILLQGLDIPHDSTSARCRSCKAARKCASCWRRRCSVTRTALLLDEPTNNLDLDSVHWLQRYLLRLRRLA